MGIKSNFGCGYMYIGSKIESLYVSTWGFESSTITFKYWKYMCMSLKDLHDLSYIYDLVST